MNQQNSQVNDFLSELRSREDFGLLLQGLFAHILLRLNKRIIELNSQGHPDIVADSGLNKWKLEVAFVSKTPYPIDDADLRAIRPEGTGWEGFLALILLGPPLSVYLISSDAAERQRNKSLLEAEIKRISNRQLSLEFTEELRSLLLANKERLANLTFSLLRAWALSGKSL